MSRLARSARAAGYAAAFGPVFAAAWAFGIALEVRDGSLGKSGPRTHP